MGLNASKGNMYDWITHTWNTVKGRCPHGCSYCYMRRWGDQPDLRLDISEFRTDLGKGNTIFVGSSCDLFAEDIDAEWIRKTLLHCYAEHPQNKYVFQSKNPARMIHMVSLYRNEFQPYRESKTPTCIGTTIESNIFYDHMGSSPHPYRRAAAMSSAPRDIPRFVTVEPVMDFGVEPMVDLILATGTRWVNIGADSGRNALPEPSAHKITELIERLVSANIEVKQKTNLRRIMG